MRGRVGDGIVIAAVEHLGIRQVGFWIIVIGLSVGVVALVVLHLVGTGLAPLKNAVSQYGISSYKTGYRAQTLAYATAGIGAAIGVASLRTTDVAFCGLCVIFAASRAVISWFPMDEPGADRTATGRRHGLLAFAAFAAANVAAGSLPSVVRNKFWPECRGPSERAGRSRDARELSRDGRSSAFWGRTVWTRRTILLRVHDPVASGGRDSPTPLGFVG